MTKSHIGQAIVTQALLAAAHEMGAKLIRSAHSPIVREAQDCSAAIINRNGQVVAQAELTAIQLGSISQTLAPCLQRFPPELLEDGDFYISNDPYNMGQHVQDIFIFTPVFYQGDLLGFTASVVHHIDLGGGAPGLNPNAADVHQEGIILPPSKYSFSRDWSGGPLERLVAANVRMPEATIGDIYAQFAANSIGSKRLIALADRYGVEFIRAAMDEMLNYSERRVRAAIGRLKDGVYTAESCIEDDGIGATPIVIRGKVEVRGETLDISFHGTDGQVATNINCPLASTVAAAVACAKSVLTGEDVPFNDGAARVITVSAPTGSVLNPKRPAPVRARLLASHRVFNTVMKALAQAAPESVIAEGFDTTTPICFSYLGQKGYNIYLEILGGGYGAAHDADGCDGVDCPLSNCSNIPVEAIEMDYPFLRVEEYSLRQGSGGRGKFRGGLGFCRSYRILEDGVHFATYSDRFVLPAQGIFGGGPGAKASISVFRKGKEIPLRSKCGFSLLKDDLVVVRTGGGGGYGYPQERSSALSDRDRRQGLAA